MDGRIAAIFGYELANVIWPPFCFREKSSSFLVWALQSCHQMLTLGRGKGMGDGLEFHQQTMGGGTPTHHHLVISPHLQMDDIFSLFSKFF
jgi:hypothetical protein